MTEIPDLELRPYTPGDWEALRCFIKANWRDDHPFSRKSLFEWQFGGFGNEGGSVCSIALFQKEQLIGFRGVIPGLYQVPSDDGRMTVIPGGSLALWMIREDFRGKGLASVMHREAQSRMQVITGAGSHPKTSVPVYLKFGFSLLEAMHRYVAPLDPDGFLRLLSEKPAPEEVGQWCDRVRGARENAEPATPDTAALGAHWESTTFPLKIFSLYRSREFWQWRYLDSTGFRYTFFGDAPAQGIVVARVEIIRADADASLNGNKVLRIIEIVPRDAQAWRGEEDPVLASLLRGVLRWGRERGCLAADFHCTNGRFFPTLRAAGFLEQDFHGGAPASSLAHLFQPLRYVTRPINALYHIEIPGRGLLKPDFEDTHMVKSENDMDRPNIVDYEGLV